jgi:hypothetical protein
MEIFYMVKLGVYFVLGIWFSIYWITLGSYIETESYWDILFIMSWVCIWQLVITSPFLMEYFKMNKLLVNYPLKNNTVFLGIIAHSAMIGKPIAYLKTGVIIGEQYVEGHWERRKTEYWARRMIWC